MAKFKEGDRVQVRARAVQGKEALEGRYAPHLANATGAILKVYTPQEIAVELDLDSLPESIRERHAEQQARMHERWLNSLSEEARNRLTQEETTFRLRYVVLLAEDDLIPLKTARSASSAPKATPASKRTVSPQSAGSAPSASTATPAAKPARKPPNTAQPPRRPTSEELEQLEEQYLKTRKRSKS
ncbi:MAG: hypothetical protein NZ874_03440 [Fimbriimonadales bacterium]|nr:hypothetical protein [Fimbriimonadales bacterium]